VPLFDDRIIVDQLLCCICSTTPRVSSWQANKIVWWQVRQWSGRIL